jgi:hypothetical protein
MAPTSSPPRAAYPHEGIAFNEHYTGDGAIIYKHALRARLRGHRVEALRLVLSIRPGRTLDQGKPAVTVEAEEEWNWGVAARRFPPPWSAEETDACFIVRDANGQALAYVYFEGESGRRSAAKLLTKDEARRIAANIAKLPGLLAAPGT